MTPTHPLPATWIRFPIVGGEGRPGAMCGAPTPTYRRGVLRGVTTCVGQLVRRNGRVICTRCCRSP